MESIAQIVYACVFGSLFAFLIVFLILHQLFDVTLNLPFTYFDINKQYKAMYGKKLKYSLYRDAVYKNYSQIKCENFSRWYSLICESFFFKDGE